MENQILIDYLSKNGFSKEGAELYINSMSKIPEEPTNLKFNSILKIIKFTLNLIKPLKTLEDFEKQEELALTDFLGEKPIEIDELMYYHILCGYVPCNCDIKMKDREHVAQNGEAEDSFKEQPWDNKTYTYMTVKSYPDNTFWYLGILPDLNKEE